MTTFTCTTPTTTDYTALAVAFLECDAVDAALKAAIHDALADRGGRYCGTIYTLDSLLKASSVKVGRKSVASWLTAEIKAAAEPVYADRRDRRTNPDGDFDGAGRWYPSDEEDADGYKRHLRGPSRAWPYSYMVGARTRKHCVGLVEMGILGSKIPDCLAPAAARIRSELLSHLKGA